MTLNELQAYYTEHKSDLVPYTNSILNMDNKTSFTVQSGSLSLSDLIALITAVQNGTIT